MGSFVGHSQVKTTCLGIHPTRRVHDQCKRNGNYNGTTVVEESGHNIINVNFNYRVGAFGFLTSEKVRENGDLNAGLLDQKFLLRWVQKNIHLVCYLLHLLDVTSQVLTYCGSSEETQIMLSSTEPLLVPDRWPRT
jgi:hypothetical protein